MTQEQQERLGALILAALAATRAEVRAEEDLRRPPRPGHDPHRRARWNDAAKASQQAQEDVWRALYAIDIDTTDSAERVAHQRPYS